MLARTSETISGKPPADRVAAQRSDAFALAQRHSRKVRLLKSALPVLAALMAVGFVGFSYLKTPAAIAVSTDGSAVSDGKLVMANPKLDGFTKDNRPYSMTALRAVQDFQNQGVVQLEGIAAQLPIDADNWAKIDAPRGTYDRDKNTLDINGDLTVTTGDGMVAKLKSAHLDIGQGGMISNDPVDIKLDGARITSQTMAIQEHGKVLIFEQRVRMDIDPSRAKMGQQANGDLDAGK